MQYEINYLVLQSKTGELDQIRAEIKKMIETQGGAITGEKNYLKRKLAYEIKHEYYGFYTVLRFDLEDVQKLADLKRELNLHHAVTRYILVKADELPALEQTPVATEATEEEAKATEAKGVLDTLATETKETVTAAAEKVTEKVKEAVTAVKEAVTPAPEKKEEVKTAEAKEETPAPAAKEEKTEEPSAEKKPKKKADDDKASLDDLDKKLDEILNI